MIVPLSCFSVVSAGHDQGGGARRDYSNRTSQLLCGGAGWRLQFQNYVLCWLAQEDALYLGGALVLAVYFKASTRQSYC